MPNGFEFIALLIWSAGWVLFALWKVIADAGKAFFAGTTSAYVRGTFSIALLWVGIILINAQRLVRLLEGMHQPAALPLANLSFACFLVSGYLACSVGLPPILWRGKPWAWRIYLAVSAVLVIAAVI
jgi:hypothetical protein